MEFNLFQGNLGRRKYKKEKTLKDLITLTVISQYEEIFQVHK